MNQSFFKATLIITVATFISKLLGSFFLVPLQNIAGDEVLGIFKLVYPVYMIALILSVAGIPIAISKLISEARAENKEKDIHHIFTTASLLAICFGILSFLVMYGLSDPLAVALGSIHTELAIIIVSATLLFAPYMAVYRGFFQGYEDMRPTAYSQMLEQFIRVIVTLGLAWFLVQKGASSSVISGWLMIGSIAGVLFSLGYLRWTFIRFKAFPMKRTKQETENRASRAFVASFSFAVFIHWSKKILTLSIPIAIGALTLAFLQLVDSFTIPHALQTNGTGVKEVHYLFGIYSGRGLSLVQIAVVFSSAVILPLIPLISKTVKQGKLEANTYIERSVKFAHLISWPVAVGLATLVFPINLVLFGDFNGSWIIAILGASSLFTSYTVLTTGILQGLNRSKQVAILLVILSVVKGVLNILIVQSVGIIGAAWATLIVYVLLTSFHFNWIKRETGFAIKFKEGFLIAFSSLLMGVVTLTPLFFFDLEQWSRLHALLFLVLIVPLGAMIYFVLIYTLKVMTKQDLQSLPVLGRRFKP
jgi:O-antigen/teichoic acid export membrane protein